jgi:hypothetical protein
MEFSCGPGLGSLLPSHKYWAPTGPAISSRDPLGVYYLYSGRGCVEPRATGTLARSSHGLARNDELQAADELDNAVAPHGWRLYSLSTQARPQR